MSRIALPAALLVATLAMVASKQIDNPDEVGVPYLYKGLMVWAFFWAFLDAYTIGANDVANAFANAVGAGTLTHRGACLIACLFEFVGVVALGNQVTDTVRKKMVDFSYFKHDPYVLATGMSMVNVGSGGWVLIATLLSMPVSTTHSVVGATLGIGITAFGWNGVVWDWNKKGFTTVVAAWFISPALSGTLAAIFYMVTKTLVLSAPTDAEALRKGLMYMPAFCFFAFGTIWGFMMMKGIPALQKTPYSTTVPITVGLAVFHGILGFVLVVPWLRRTIVDKENLPWYTLFYIPAVGVGQYGYIEDSPKDQEKGAVASQPMQQVAPQSMQRPPAGMPGMMPPGMMPMGMQQPMMGGMPGPYGGMPGPYGMPVMGSAFGADGLDAIIGGGNKDIGARREEDAEMHAAAFECGKDTEELFKFLQVVSCCFFSLSHGANDVANAVAPFASVWMVYSTGKVSKKADVPIWVLIYGAVAIDIGLLTMGHYIMAALGNRLTLQSPARGFCIELGAMFCVMVASRVGVPVSTTHCISGATIAVGLCNGNTQAVNWKLVAIIFGGWLITCPAAAFITGMIFWGIVSSPKPMPENGFFTGSVPAKE